MHLSPLIFSSLIQRLRQVKDSGEPIGGRVTEIVMWRCNECSATYDDEDEAEDCCAVAESTDSDTNCPVCGGEHNEHREAADCCLWKDLDAPTRWRMADAVEAGSTWAEQLGLRAH